MATLLFNGVGLVLTAAAVGMLAFKATTGQPLCTGQVSELLCMGQYLSVLAVLTLWVSSFLCQSKMMTSLLTMLADLVLAVVVVSIVTTDPQSFIDLSNPSQMVGNALIVLLAIWRLSLRINDVITPAPSPYYQYYQ